MGDDEPTDGTDIADDDRERATAPDPLDAPASGTRSDDGESGRIASRLSPQRRARAERALTWILGIAIVLSVAALVYVALFPPQSGTAFTEFYLLGPNGTAGEYPTSLAPQETGSVVVGISNHERESVEYRVRVTWNGTETDERTVRVTDGETREFTATLTAPADPGRYRVRFLLYNETSSDPFSTTRLWITVRDDGDRRALGDPGRLHRRPLAGTSHYRTDPRPTHGTSR